ncbi:hypothetical protein VEE49_37920 [Escherichia coli]|nr:hypothetical protein VEE49_37920 [Escherichia coli]
MSGFFQRLFGKDNKPAIARGPLGLHLNSGFTLDTLAFRLLEDELLIALPGEEFTVAAVSHIDLGGGSQIFRYYTSGDEFLQINTTGGEDIDDIDDIGNDSNLLIVFYVQIMPDDFVMQLHRF